MSKYDKDRILESTDIVEVIGERVTLVRKGSDFMGLCPFHADHSPSLAVSPKKQIFKCWSCGVGGDVIKFIMLRDRVQFPEALETLARRLGIEPDEVASGGRELAARREALRAALDWARGCFQRNLREPAGAAALEYALDRRGLTPETVEQFGLGFALHDWNALERAAARVRIAPDVLADAGLVKTGDQGRTYDVFRNRLIFPIHDHLGRTVAFGGRALGDEPPKYLNSRESALFSKSRVLFGLDRAREAIEAARAAIVVEGYMDAVLLHQFGFRNVVATLGTALSDAHVKLLKPLCRTLLLCFDGDAAGNRAAERAVSVALGSDLTVKVVVLDGAKDPADYVLAEGQSGFEGRLSEAVDALEFKWRQSVAAFSKGGREARRAAVQDFIGFVAHATRDRGIDPLEQGLIAGRLSELIGLSPQAVIGLLAAQRRKRPWSASPGGETAAAAVRSAYDESVAGLSPGLIAAMEELLGLLVTAPACWSAVRDELAEAAHFSRTWGELYQICIEVHEELGQYSIGDVVRRSEDPAVLDALEQAVRRAPRAEEARALFSAAQDRLLDELNMLRRTELQSRLRGDDSAQQAAFADLQRLARQAHFPVPAEQRRNVAGA